MALSIQNVKKTWRSVGGTGDQVVFDDFTHTFVLGKQTIIVGPSGVGKSTLLRLIAGLDLPDHGTITYEDSVPSVTKRSGVIAQNLTDVCTLVFQEYDKSLFPWQTVEAALHWALRGRRSERAEPADLVPLWDAFGLDQNILDRYPHELSGGQRQRIALMRALARHPRVLLMDEPFGAIDAFTRYELEDMLLKHSHSDGGLTVVLATHDLDEAVYLAETIAVLGGTPARLVQSIDVNEPLDLRTQSFRETEEFRQARKALREAVIRAQQQETKYAGTAP